MPYEVYKYGNNVSLCHGTVAPRVLPHAPQVPASDGRIIGRGQLCAVVMWAPLACCELPLPFALQSGAARDLWEENRSTYISIDDCIFTSNLRQAYSQSLTDTNDNVPEHSSAK